jgi:pimeloyl-ACP methyl ester carboxylesterase
LSLVTRAYIDGTYGQMHYYLAHCANSSDQPPLLCLHQTPKSGGDYAPLMAVLAQQRIVVAPDTPGYGASDPPPVPLTIEGYATAIMQFVDRMQDQRRLPPGPFDVMGYHTGSVIATALALARPNRVRKVIMVSLPAFSAAERQQRLATLDQFPTPKADGSHLLALWQIAQELNDARLSVESRHLAIAECFRPGSRLTWGFQAVYHYDFGTALRTLPQPTLILNPQDELCALTRAAAPLLPAGTLYELDGTGNGFLEIEPKRVSRIIGAFLDQSHPRQNYVSH